MRTKLCEMFGIEVPIVAFSHCRDVVVEASKAGGLGVFGAEAFTVEELAIELAWIEEHIGGRPYGVDVLIATRSTDISGYGNADPESVLPERNRNFVSDLLDKHGVPHLPADEENEMTRERLHTGRNTAEYSARLLEVAFGFPGVRLIVSALGTPPRAMIARAHAANIKVAALVGSVRHAQRQLEAGVDMLIAQGHEAGGHTGEIATMVLTPQVVDAVAPLPVLAAGGIASGRQMAAALALGAEGVWCGSVWLTTVQSNLLPEAQAKLLAATSSDTLRSKSLTGKPARMVRTEWSDAWEAPDAPESLGRPLQGLLIRSAVARIERSRNQPLISSYVGQVVGQMNEQRTVRQVFSEMLTEYADAMERVNGLSEPAATTLA